jgi:hypothetical protein
MSFQSQDTNKTARTIAATYLPNTDCTQPDPEQLESETMSILQPQNQSLTQPHTSRAEGYTNPVTGISFTHAELEELAYGKVNKHGIKVYFKPGFVNDDPWWRLKERRKEERTVNEGKE